MPLQMRLEQIYMFSNSLNIDEAVNKVTKLDSFIFTENMEEGFNELSENLNIELNYLHKRKSSKSLDLSDDALEFLRETLAPEIEFYNRLKNLKSY
jgi:hypothetical protein